MFWPGRLDTIPDGFATGVGRQGDHRRPRRGHKSNLVTTTTSAFSAIPAGMSASAGTASLRYGPRNCSRGDDVRGVVTLIVNLEPMTVVLSVDPVNS